MSIQFSFRNPATTRILRATGDGVLTDCYTPEELFDAAQGHLLVGFIPDSSQKPSYLFKVSDFSTRDTRPKPGNHAPENIPQPANPAWEATIAQAHQRLNSEPDLLSLGLGLHHSWEAPQPDIKQIFSQLCWENTQNFCFSLTDGDTSYVGASPELVLSAQLMRDGSVRYTTSPTAGSMSHEETEILTPGQAEENLFSPQNLSIHSLTVEKIADYLRQNTDILAPYSQNPWRQESWAVYDLTTPLIGTINGQLRPTDEQNLQEAQLSMLRLAFGLRRSPAITGFPYELAGTPAHKGTTNITDGLVGWIDLRENSTLGCLLARATRMATIHTNPADNFRATVDAFDTIPLMAESLPDVAYHRIQAKLSTISTLIPPAN
ncbi:MAG: chorismate-binding protein [Corynebacterium sp.]|nr:chorismate-binding protein [Corynebacterium sp.]